jgi:hypothetical protein
VLFLRREPTGQHFVVPTQTRIAAAVNKCGGASGVASASP